LRGNAPNPSRLLCELVEGENGLFTWVTSARTGKDPKEPKWAIYLKWIADHKPTYQTEIASAHGITWTTISQQLDIARQTNYLDGLRITDEGDEFIRRTFE